MRVRFCIPSIVLALAFGAEAQADHDRLAVRLFQGCMDEVDQSVPVTAKKGTSADFHTVAHNAVSSRAISMCALLIEEVCQVDVDEMQSECLTDVSEVLALKTDEILSDLPDGIRAEGFDPIFYKSALSDGREPWTTSSADENLPVGIAQLLGESGRYFHARSARRLYEKSILDASE